MSARVLDCPQCGAPVNFRSSITVFAVCEHCRSMIVLRGADAQLIGVMAALPPDLSPFQIGTRGEWKGRVFAINILNSVLYALLGVAIFCVAFVIVDRITPFALWKELVEKQNTALAIVVGFAALGICVIVAAAIH